MAQEIMKGLFGIPQEQMTRINPDAGVNIGMQELANRANYQASTYGAREAGAAGAASGFMNMLGSVAQGYLGGRGSASGAGRRSRPSGTTTTDYASYAPGVRPHFYG